MSEAKLDTCVVVIGAGAAGLAAAKLLICKKRKVIVLEARDRIGGRAHTTGEPFGFPYDCGAQWLEAPGAFKGFGTRRAVVDQEHDRYFVDGVETCRSVVKKAHRSLRAQLDLVAKSRVDQSIASAINGRGPAYEIAKAELGPLSVGLDVAKISTIDEYKQDCAEDRLFKAGYGAAVKRWAAGVRAPTGEAVSQIACQKNGVIVTTSKMMLGKGTCGHHHGADWCAHLPSAAPYLQATAPDSASEGNCRPPDGAFRETLDLVPTRGAQEKQSCTPGTISFGAVERCMRFGTRTGGS